MGSSAHTVHSARLQIHQNSPGHVFALVALIVVDIDALQLQVHQLFISAGVLAIGLDAMLITDDLPELQEIRKRYFMTWDKTKSGI